jgi:hypothetical protein
MLKRYQITLCLTFTQLKDAGKDKAAEDSSHELLIRQCSALSPTSETAFRFHGN